MKSRIALSIKGVLISLGLCASGWANDVLITARIDGTQFVNTTPWASYCPSFSIGGSLCRNAWTVDLPISYRKRVDVNSSDDRDKIYVKLPPRQALTLQNQLTGQTSTMFVSFRGVSQRVTWVHETVMGASPRNCVATGGVAGGKGWSQTLWHPQNSTNPAPCISNKTGNTQVEESEITYVGVEFRPEFPAAASLAPGRWEGVIDYPIGTGQGFDFGNTTQADTSVIRFRVSFDVLHEIRVDFPAQGTEVKLAPQGSWVSVMNTSKAPIRLYHDSPLRLWAGSAFNVYLACQHDRPNNLCHLKNSSADHVVPVNVSLSLPGGFLSNGLPVTRLPLIDRIANAKTIVPTSTATNAPGTLHFEVSGSDASEMLKYPGAKYSGEVTIIYDANP